MSKARTGETNISMWLPTELVTRIDARAAEEDRDRSSFIRSTLKKNLPKRVTRLVTHNKKK
jgi:metal-responsive CopG/Arc/MetJ family transcriptional regulator